LAAPTLRGRGNDGWEDGCSELTGPALRGGQCEGHADRRAPGMGLCARLWRCHPVRGRLGEASTPPEASGETALAPNTALGTGEARLAPTRTPQASGETESRCDLGESLIPEPGLSGAERALAG